MSGCGFLLFRARQSSRLQDLGPLPTVLGNLGNHAETAPSTASIFWIAPAYSKIGRQCLGGQSDRARWLNLGPASNSLKRSREWRY